MNDNDKSFLDGNTLAAIALSVLFFIGWQFYIQKKYPQPEASQVEAVATQAISEEGTAASILQEAEALTSKASAEEMLPENVLTFAGKNFNLFISSQGMGFKEVVLNNFSDRKDQAIVFGGQIDPGTLKEDQKPEDPQFADIKIGNFATLYDGQPISFDVQKISETEYLGKGSFSQGTVVKSIVFNENNYSAKINVLVTWTGDSSKPIETYIVDRAQQTEKASLFVPSYEGSRFFVLSDGSEERERVNLEESSTYNYEKMSLVAVDSQYFSLSFLDKSAIVPSVKLDYDSVKALTTARIYHRATSSNTPLEINYTAFMGPKKLDILNSIDEKMARLVDYGFFGFISKPILSLLKGIYGVIHNWGIAIILVTILIRLLLLPINISSHKSMSKMQKIQPLLKQVREKYKDDPQKVNQETMLIMKREKANPLGGCLPMLMQIPVFFALFTVIGQSIELYKSPFAFWIQDLSYQDPFFVLPVVVGGLYFLQMQLTPTASMDPTQAKVMKIIPLVFVFFMFSMPSGLTLYFAINTIFGIGQQYILQREKRKAVTA